ncbi:MAG: transposase [Syntrophorhabdus sp. PtaU1.Bin050]|jgi:DNA replication protein DnaC|nr:MAG: transposase [Syntrophorhabdus sp. PtaU1.Bin050]
MLNEQTFEKLSTMKLFGMMEALRDQMGRPMEDLSFEDRLGMLVDAQWLWKENKRMKRLLKNAKLKLPASMEDIDYRTPRGLDKSVLLNLGTCEWVRRHQNVIVVGPTGTGKTFLACALAHKACREGLSAFYIRTPKLYSALAVARADGSYSKTLARLARVSVLILDDLALAALTDPERRDLLEVVEDRNGTASTIVTSQLPVENWHEMIGDPTIADALLDRLVHNAHRIALKGESMRKRKASLTHEETMK